MKKLLAIISLLSIFLTKDVFAITANSNVKIVSAIAISETTQLNFGSVIAAGTSGTVEVTASPSSVRTPTTVSVIPASTFTPGVFSVTGENSATYAITLASTTTLSGPGTSMTASLVSSPASTGALSSGGAQTLYVGGTLTVGANQTVGVYAGTYSITVAYN